jgi:hypothetical protein
MTKKIECPIHGLNDSAYVCQHLNLTDKIGFIETYDPQNPCSEILQALCQKCDDVVMEEGEWNARVESYTKIKLICIECFAQMREFNNP